MEVLRKMDEVGIKPAVQDYNAVIDAAAAAAAGRRIRRASPRPQPYNDTALRAEFIDKAA
jgi:hypothetical protein